jgi:hypothetical protein
MLDCHLNYTNCGYDAYCSSPNHPTRMTLNQPTLKLNRQLPRFEAPQGRLPASIDVIPDDRFIHGIIDESSGLDGLDGLVLELNEAVSELEASTHSARAPSPDLRARRHQARGAVSQAIPARCATEGRLTSDHLGVQVIVAIERRLTRQVGQHGPHRHLEGAPDCRRGLVAIRESEAAVEGLRCRSNHRNGHQGHKHCNPHHPLHAHFADPDPQPSERACNPASSTQRVMCNQTLRNSDHKPYNCEHSQHKSLE